MAGEVDGMKRYRAQDERPGPDPTAGLPIDLARVLRDQSVIVPQDAAVFEMIASWQNAPSNTASASIVRPCAVHQPDTSGCRCVRCGVSWSRPPTSGEQ